MAKELTHRADELKQLGWNQEDLYKYIELWDYRQRWGSINLEREDRQFLRKAESLLPEITKNKVSIKKPLKEKSYYCWIQFFLDEMNNFESKEKLESGMRGVWPIFLEEELRVIDYYEPVLGLPDTIKAKSIGPIREALAQEALKKYEKSIITRQFDFLGILHNAKSNGRNASWRSLRDGEFEGNQDYQIIDKSCVLEFRKKVSEKLLSFIKENLPSLAETDKSLPPNDWIH
ncbi:hypothetical protein [Prochlorococcus marinus]|uniref:Uncharacterized protein n=1 Tax=Prochlorococcus marinus XMU1408 TaxID=2213228 RepID=A0A318R3M3_PROMR|nr:hypothetical protein [Prochlorococcus marinus]MBW3041671.1 hypothetical protein [Prochlorococcus marinus str. XMU1408]PYE02824.1 hypothetical protein DNJ73_03470 [Prochlorococcus marinus XMU1408]